MNAQCTTREGRELQPGRRQLTTVEHLFPAAPGNHLHHAGYPALPTQVIAESGANEISGCIAVHAIGITDQETEADWLHQVPADLQRPSRLTLR
ncbi:MAG: hypothetical protein GPOALKHO_001947 [Sodalis sp.]|nr:MAG: hypothetical protein GPOALKHO_001947 [Sodalis sp.]